MQGNTMTRQWPRLLAGGALLLLAQFAHAQYSWIDDKGTRVFSDRPPPPNTPASRILKSPRPAAQAPVPFEGKPGAAPASPAPVLPAAPKPPSLAEQDAAFRQRQARREDDARKAQEEELKKQADAERCTAARQESLQLSSGMRIAQVNDKGERSFMTDEDRKRRQEAAQRVLQDCR
jgi:hypothetical protein